MSEVVSDCCPYCGTRQIGIADEAGFYRCHDCNYHVREDWLVPEGGQNLLNDDRAVLCPWCGYPAGVVQDFPDEGEVMCEGCSGTLVAPMLVTQAALAVDRQRGSKERNMILMIMVLVFLAMMVVGALISI